jgi:glycosyltransferase involved in cell wall biosynthesis
MKVALIYDRVNKWGGAERVLLALHEVFPKADLFTAVYSPAKAKWAKVFPKVIPSFLRKIPLTSSNHEFLGTFTPFAFESFDFGEYELVISVTSEAAKGIITRPGTTHICYCLTPTRYLWSAHDYYFAKPPAKFRFIPFFKYLSRPLVKHLKAWDKMAAQRPDKMIAISTAVRQRIRKYYQRDAQVIFPPVDTNKFIPKDVKKGNYYLVVSRLIPYKRVDLAIAAFNKLGLPLLIVGSGSEEGRLRQLAKRNIKFVGEVPDEELADYYRKSKALIFPQEEDFGIVVLEAQATGTPVIAFKAGGALDTVILGKTGLFFDKQTVSSLMATVRKFQSLKFDPGQLRKGAESFSKERFKKEFLETVNHYFQENS